MNHGFRRGQPVRLLAKFQGWYPGYAIGIVTQPTSLGIAVKVNFEGTRRAGREFWIDMNHLEKR